MNIVNVVNVRTSQSAHPPAPALTATHLEIGAEILLRIALEFDKTIEWLLTGEDHPKL